MNELIEKIKNEYTRRIDIIYTNYHSGQYFDEIAEMKKDLENTMDFFRNNPILIEYQIKKRRQPLFFGACF